MEHTYKWLENHGIMREEDYPYTGRKGQCKDDPSKYYAKVISWKKLGNCWSTWCPVDEREVRDFLLETGPLAIAMNANTLQMYRGGIVDDDTRRCNPSGMNHAVLLTGYGHDETVDLDFWIVKNSWGKTWGENGVFKSARGKGTCGINQYITTTYIEVLK